jgi:tetratricopeptide (TPR) repeat protein
MMKRRLRALLLPFVAAAGIGIAGGGGVGVSLGAAPPAALGTTWEEREALDLLDDDKLLSARTRAEAILRADPESVVGHYVLGSVLRDAEGSLARATSHLREARRLYEAELGVSSGGAEAPKLHREILIGLEYTAGLMEQYDDALAILDDHDALYDPDLIGQHAWPMMKLHRYDEARAFARRAIASDSPFQKNLGLNALCAIEAEAHERRAAYEQCKAALDHARARATAAIARGDKRIPLVAVHAHNAALGALSVLRHDEVERLALEGTQRLESTVSNPWRLLVDLYLTEGRAGDAVAAIRQMQRWYAHQPPGSRDQRDAATAAETALLLLAAGEPSAGLRFISRAIERPDRQGLSSGQPDQALGGHALIRRALLRLNAERAAERASVRGTIPRGMGLLSAIGSRAAALPDDERVIRVLSDETRLDATLRVYLDGSLDEVPTWLLGDLVPVLGPGVVAVALSKARREEAMPEMGPYFDAIEAEVALARGELARAEALAGGALEKLPRAEALLRARVAAIAGEAARRKGDGAAASGYFQRALELDPGTIRRLRLAIPAVVRQNAASSAAERAAVVLRRSPRLYEAAGGFEVHVEEGTAGALRACLVAPFGTSLGCGQIAAAEGEHPSDAGARLADEFHRVVFSLQLPITDTDLRSLDGATAIARDAGRERLRGILEDAPDDGKEGDD